MSLETEIAYFEEQRQAWLESHAGEFALLQGHNLGGFFKEWEDAFREGIEKFGVAEPFLVKQVLLEDEVFMIF